MVVLLHSTYRLLLMALFTIWVQGESEKDTTCADIGGICVPHDDNNCSYEVDYPGCDEDEKCCHASRSFFGRQLGSCEGVKPPKACKKRYKGVCKTKCPDDRIETGKCSRTCKCCGCKDKERRCKENRGHCIMKDVQECNGKTKNRWCAGKKCTCCIPKEVCWWPFQMIKGVGCIYLHPQNTNWKMGQQMCAGINASLFVAQTVQQYLTLNKHYIANPPGDNDIWVGVKDETWLNGRPVAKDEWIAGGPTGKPCGFIDASTVGGHKPTYFLNQFDCEGNGAQFLCQRDID